MRIKLFVFLMAGLFSLLLVSTSTFASSDWDSDLVLKLFKSALDDQDYDISIYNDESVLIKSSLGVSKDNAIKAEKSDKDKARKALEGLISLSESGYNLLETMGYEDKLCIVRFMDDVYDETSDVWFIVVNGHVVYDIFY